MVVGKGGGGAGCGGPELSGGPRGRENVIEQEQDPATASPGVGCVGQNVGVLHLLHAAYKSITFFFLLVERMLWYIYLMYQALLLAALAGSFPGCSRLVFRCTWVRCHPFFLFPFFFYHRIDALLCP